MKTTIEIADDLLEKAKQQAKREHKTLRQVIEEALRHQLRPRSEKRFRLKKHSFKGRGVKSNVLEGKWEAVRDLIYRLEQ